MPSIPTVPSTPTKPQYIATPTTKPVLPTTQLIAKPMPRPTTLTSPTGVTMPVVVPEPTRETNPQDSRDHTPTVHTPTVHSTTSTPVSTAKPEVPATPVPPASRAFVPVPKYTTTKPVTKPQTPLVKPAATTGAAALAKFAPRALTPKLESLATRAEALASAPVPTAREQVAQIVAKVTASVPTLADKQLAGLAAQSGITVNTSTLAPDSTTPAPEVHRVEKHQITMDLLNTQQREAVELAAQGVSFNLIGSAGSGKTTTQRMVLLNLALSGILRTLPEFDHKYLPRGILSVGVVSYMNKAVNNIRSALPPEFKNNALTIHKLLEYSPFEEEYTELNEDGQLETKKRRGFRPIRHSGRPATGSEPAVPANLIEGLTHLIVEESSTVDMLLWNQLLDALPNRGADITFILLGDICQLPPVMGQSILRNSLATGRNVELTQIYRTADDSPIKSFAIAINEGKPFTDAELKSKFHKQGELEFVPLSGKHAVTGKPVHRAKSTEVVYKIANFYKSELASGNFVPFRDTILCPYRVNRDDGLNCQHLNLLLADFDGKRRDAVVHEVQAGFHRKYLAVGDPVVMDKKEYRIANIVPNPAYKGLPTKPASNLLSRTGHYEGDSDSSILELETGHLNDIMNLDLNAILAKKHEAEADTDSASRSASHILTLTTVDSDPDMADIEVEVSQVGSIADMDFAYATTVHKAIGSEWERVYLAMHHSMSSMVSRELLYTAVTRAKTFLHIIYDGADPTTAKPNTNMIAKAIISPETKGNNLAEKIAYIQKQDARKTEDTKAVLTKFAPKPRIPTTPTPQTPTK